MATTFTLMPRFTTLLGGGTTYYTDSLDVAAYKEVRIQVLVDAVINSGTVSAQLEESADQITWTALGSASSVSVGSVTTISRTDPAAYIRVKIVVSVANSAATLWVKGVAREA